jgi:uncharacterized protein
MADAYHAGERTVQTRAGVSALAARVGRSIRSSLPSAAQALLDERRWLVLGALDGDGYPRASVLAGSAGFVRAIDAIVRCGLRRRFGTATRSRAA